MTISHIRSSSKATKRETMQALTYNLSKHSRTNMPKIAIDTMISMKLYLPMLHGSSKMSHIAAMIKVTASRLLWTFFV